MRGAGLATSPTPRLCEAVKSGGEPCKAFPLRGRRFCLAHDPERRDQHRAISRRGGQASWRQRLETLEERGRPFDGILTALLDVVTELRDPKLPTDQVPRLRAALYGLSIALRAVELSELDDAVAEICRRLQTLERVGGQFPAAIGGRQ